MTLAMKHYLPVLVLAALSSFAQAPQPLQAPLEGVPPAYRKLPVGRLTIPKSLAEWNAQRAKVKAIVVRSLGDLPPRPSPLKVRTVKIDRKEGCTIEKFVFSNGVDSDVPGYLAIPSKRDGPRPAILTMHGHSSSKDNMFGYEPTSQDVAEMLARRGYVVIGIDNYFNGERKGSGPAGDREVMALVRTRRCRCSS